MRSRQERWRRFCSSRREPSGRMGVSGDFAKGHVADNGAYLAYKNGFFSSLSFFWSGEAGYRFVDKSCHARAGIDAMFLFVGIQTGIILAYQPDHARDYTQGAYAGIGGAIPIGRKAAWFLFTGGQFFLDRAWEFYVSTSVVFNLFG